MGYEKWRKLYEGVRRACSKLLHWPGLYIWIILSNIVIDIVVEIIQQVFDIVLHGFYSFKLMTEKEAFWQTTKHGYRSGTLLPDSQVTNCRWQFCVYQFFIRLETKGYKKWNTPSTHPSNQCCIHWFKIKSPHKCGLLNNGGPDGARTRDLRRDRPAF